MELLLKRIYAPRGTNGTLYESGNPDPVCFTIELPWRNNLPAISCIPEGRYRMEMRYSPHFHTHLLLYGVKNRSLILVHPANNAMKELEGCIAPVTKLTGEGKGVYSKRAFTKLMLLISSKTDKAPVYITIKKNTL